MSNTLGDKPKRRLGLVAPPPSPESSLDTAKERALAWTRESARAELELGNEARLLKSTVSLCPDCKDYVPAMVYSLSGKVFAKKHCPKHGRSIALFESDERFYFLSNKDISGRRFDEERVFDIPAFEVMGQSAACCEDGACGTATDQSTNKTCTILVEVTNACNLTCPVCYSDAGSTRSQKVGDKRLPLEAFKRYIERLVAQKGGLDSVQLTGGEALLHPEVFEMVAFLHAQPKVKKIYLPTNGILISKPETIDKLSRYRDKLMVLLQFDGVHDASDKIMRGATPKRARERAIDLLNAARIPIQLTMTVAMDVNDRDIGAVVELGLRYESVKVIALQPTTSSGRYDVEIDPMRRMTLSDVAKGVERQARARMTLADFVPIPCSHPNCGWITLFVRRFGIVRNIIRYVDLPKIIGQVAYKTLLSTDELQSAVSSGGGLAKRLVGALGKKLVRSTDVFTIAIKPFMDRHTYDQDRIASCCHHLMDQQGNATSFCEYNALLRVKDSWQDWPSLTAPAVPS
jgi:7,8-dihydro-6-hydroxymethylpterin dimethyltransferase